MLTQRLIINADDLGLNHQINETIFALMEEGLLTSATLMTNGPAAEDAAVRLAEFSHCSFGVHLNVTEFEPLSKHPGLAALLDHRGHMSGDPRRINITPALLRGIYAEWTHQVQRAQDFQVPISHLDSHHHVHTTPQLFPLLKMLQKKFAIRAIRSSLNVYAPDHPPSRALMLGKKLWNTALQWLPRTRTTDLFVNLPVLADPACRIPPFQTAEVMTHPGAPDDPDTPLLRSGWRERLAFPSTLISYNDL